MDDVEGGITLDAARAAKEAAEKSALEASMAATECPLKFQDFQEHAIEIHPKSENILFDQGPRNELMLGGAHSFLTFENATFLKKLLNEVPVFDGLEKTEQQKVNDLNLTLIDKYHIQTPNELFTKHIVHGKITDKKAIHLSNKRGRSFAEGIGENTVFEDPIHFYSCSIDRLHLLDAKSNCVYIPERRVRTFQCRYDPNLEDYTMEDLGMKIPILEMHNNGKYHFLKDSLHYDDYAFATQILRLRILAGIKLN